MKTLTDILNLPETARESDIALAVIELVNDNERILAIKTELEKELQWLREQTADLFIEHLQAAKNISDEDAIQAARAMWEANPALASAALLGDSEAVLAANPYGCNQYGEGWKQPHNGKQSKSGSAAKKGDSSPAPAPAPEKKEEKVKPKRTRATTPKKEEAPKEQPEPEETKEEDDDDPYFDKKANKPKGDHYDNIKLGLFDSVVDAIVRNKGVFSSGFSFSNWPKSTIPPTIPLISPEELEEARRVFKRTGNAYTAAQRFMRKHGRRIWDDHFVPKYPSRGRDDDDLF